MNTSLKHDLRTKVRDALVQQVARKMDDHKEVETSRKTVKSRLREDSASADLFTAVYGTRKLENLSNRAVGRFVAAVHARRRQNSKRVPVRA